MTNIEKFNNLSVEELENYGRDTQQILNQGTDELLKGFKCIDFGEYGKKVLELKTFADKSSKRITTIAPIAKINQFLGRYDNMEEQLGLVEKSVNAAKDRLNEAINLTLKHHEMVTESIHHFDMEIEELREYIDYLKDLQSKGELTDDLKLQIAANRLKILTTFKVSAEHVSIESLMQVKAYKETVTQLEDTIIDILPNFKLQLINELGLRVHKDCIQIIDGVSKLANDSILETSRQISDMAIATQNNRQREIIKPETLLEANRNIQNALSQVIKDASKEADTNIEIANKLSETSDQMRKLISLNNQKLIS